jgi:hypothetical protein
VEKTGKFIVEKDLYGLFDLVAIRPNQVLFIQVKTNRPAVQQPYIDFSKKYAGSHFSVNVITWFDRKGFLIQKYFSTGRVTTEDLRTSTDK